MGCIKSNLFPNDDGRVFINEIEQVDDILIPHPNAAVAGGLTDFVFVFRAVDIDKAVARVRIIFFETVEPKNTRRDEVFRVGQRIVRAKGDARFENCPGRGGVADFFPNAKFSHGRFHAALFRTQAETRTRDWIRAQRFIATF